MSRAGRYRSTVLRAFAPGCRSLSVQGAGRCRSKVLALSLEDAEAGLMDLRIVRACATIGIAVASSRARALAPPKAPVVAIVGCAAQSARPYIWNLSHASQRTESSRAGISKAETEQ